MCVYVCVCVCVCVCECVCVCVCVCYMYIIKIIIIIVIKYFIQIRGLAGHKDSRTFQACENKNIKRINTCIMN